MNKIMLSMVLMLLTVASVNAQEIYGNAFFSYEVALDGVDDLDSRSGFVIDRAVLGATSDFGSNDDFSAAVGIQIDDTGVRPRDASLAYEHDSFYAIGGLVEPFPVLFAERVWGYRELLPTIQNRNGIVPSREFGFGTAFEPTSNLSAGVMVTNGEAFSFSDSDNYHRVYGQLALTGDRFLFGGGVNWMPNASDVEDGLVGSVAGVYLGESYRVGAEAYSDLTGALNSNYGLSAFGSVDVAPRTSAIVRADYTKESFTESDELLLLGGVRYQPTSNVALTPNVVWTDNSSVGSDLFLRLTTSFTLNN